MPHAGSLQAECVPPDAHGKHPSVISCRMHICAAIHSTTTRFIRRGVGDPREVRPRTGNTHLLALVDASAQGTADMVGNLGRQSGVVTRAGTDDLRGGGDLPTRAHAQ